jgi:hypothetical protein
MMIQFNRKQWKRIHRKFRVRNGQIRRAVNWQAGMDLLKSIHAELSDTFRAHAVADWKMDRIAPRNAGKAAYAE